MEITILPADIQVLCKIVPGFPSGIKSAFEALMAEFGYDGRDYYGISYINGSGDIVYKVAVRAKVGDSSRVRGYEAQTIAGGEWLTEAIPDWMSRTDEIKNVFTKLMDDERFDSTVPCVEWYKDPKEMLCMVKVIDNIEKEED